MYMWNLYPCMQFQKNDKYTSMYIYMSSLKNRYTIFCTKSLHLPLIMVSDMFVNNTNPLHILKYNIEHCLPRSAFHLQAFFSIHNVDIINPKNSEYVQFIHPFEFMVWLIQTHQGSFISATYKCLIPDTNRYNKWH